MNVLTYLGWILKECVFANIKNYEICNLLIKFLLPFKDDHIGIIKVNMSLKQVVDRWASFVQQITEDNYGHSPEIRISGHVNAKFPYIEMPLDYILPELLKNAVRATIGKSNFISKFHH